MTIHFVTRKTNKEMIVDMLKEGTPLSCWDITKRIIKIKYPKGATYLSGSISSILAKMVKDNDRIEYAPGKAIRGGHLYQIKTKHGYEPKTP